MNDGKDNIYRGSVLLTEFSDPRPGEIVEVPLDATERREISTRIAIMGGMVLEQTPKRLLAFFPKGDTALAMAAEIREKVEKLRKQPGRLAIGMRGLLGYGSFKFVNNRVASDWMHKLGGLITRLPDNGVGALQEFVEQSGAVFGGELRVLRSNELYLVPIDGGNTSSAETRHAPLLQSADQGVFSQLTLRVRGEARQVRPADCPLLIGRDKTCGVVIQGDQASRVHGRIEFSQDKFFYVDDSRNGSYVLSGTGEELFLKKGEKVILAGEGAISPGAPVSKQTGEVVRYACKSARLTVSGDAAAGDTRPLDR